MTARQIGNAAGVLALLNGSLLALEMRRSVSPWEIDHFGEHAITAMWALSLLLPALAAWKASRYWALCFACPVAIYIYAMSHMC
jgi:hypothetical protein